MYKVLKLEDNLNLLKKKRLELMSKRDRMSEKCKLEDWFDISNQIKNIECVIFKKNEAFSYN